MILHLGSAWRAFLSALFALPMTDEQLAIYNRVHGAAVAADRARRRGLAGLRAPRRQELHLGAIAVFLATASTTIADTSPPASAARSSSSPPTRKQARVIFRYVRALLTGIPMLRRMIERETADTFDLTDGATIEVHVVVQDRARLHDRRRSVRRAAFWPTDDAAEPDYEVLNALRPGMATIPNAMLLCASSPYARRGAYGTRTAGTTARTSDPDPGVARRHRAR